MHGWQGRRLGAVFAAKNISLSIKFIRQAREKEHTKDEFLEFGGVHLATKDVRRFEKKALQLRESDFFPIHNSYEAPSLLGI
jgi:hypothetical protein